MTEKNIKRANIRMNDQLYRWYQDQADELHMPVQSLMIIALNDYKENKGKSTVAMLTDILNTLSQEDTPPFKKENV